MDTFHLFKFKTVKGVVLSMMGFGACNTKHSPGVVAPDAEHCNVSAYTEVDHCHIPSARNRLVNRFIGATELGGTTRLLQSTPTAPPQSERPSFLRLNSCGESSEEESPIINTKACFGNHPLLQQPHQIMAGNSRCAPPAFGYYNKPTPQWQQWAPMPVDCQWDSYHQNYPKAHRELIVPFMPHNQMIRQFRPMFPQPYFPPPRGAYYPFQFRAPRFPPQLNRMGPPRHYNKNYCGKRKHKSPKPMRVHQNLAPTTKLNQNQNQDTIIKEMSQDLEKVHISSASPLAEIKLGPSPVGKENTVGPQSVLDISECTPTSTYHVYTSSHSISICDKPSVGNATSDEQLSPKSNSVKVINFSCVDARSSTEETPQVLPSPRVKNNISSDNKQASHLSCESIVANVNTSSSPGTKCFRAQITVAHEGELDSATACVNKKKKTRPSSKKRRRQKIQSGKTVVGTVTSTPLPISLSNSKHCSKRLRGNLHSESESSDAKSPPISFVIDFSSDRENDQQSSPCLPPSPISNFSFVISATDTSSSSADDSSDSDFWDNDDDADNADAQFDNVAWDPMSLQGMSFHITCNILPTESAAETEEDNSDIVNCSAENEIKKLVHEANQKWNDSYTSRCHSKTILPTKVQFVDPEDVEVHILEDYPEESQQARAGDWEKNARDRARFQKHVDEIGKIISPCLQEEHRLHVYNSRSQSS